METEIFDQQILTPRKIKQKRKMKILMFGVIGLGVLVVVFVIMVGVFANRASKLGQENNGLKERLLEMEQKKIEENMNKRLNFTYLKLRDVKFDIDINEMENDVFSQVQTLNLTKNLISMFVGNNVPSLKQLDLDYNPIFMFANNYLPNIKKLDFAKNPLLISFVGNNIENIEEMIFYEPFTIMNFSGNTLNKISKFNWVTGQNSFALTLNNNTMNQITNLQFQSRNILSFQNNQFKNLKNFTTYVKQDPIIFPEQFPMSFNDNNLSSLQHLSFQHEQLIFKFNNLTNLKTLDITNCTIAFFKNNILNKDLQLSIRNGVDNFYFQDNNLQNLDIRNNNFQFIKIQSPILSTLYIDKNSPSNISFIYNYVNSLTNFTYSNVLFKQFCYNQMNSLLQIDLYNRSITKFLNNSLPLIKSLDLSENPISIFDNSITYPNTISSLNLSNTQIKIFKNNYLSELVKLNFQKYSTSIDKIQIFSSNTLPKYNSTLFFTKSLTQFNYNNLTLVQSIQISSQDLKQFNSNILPSIKNLLITNSSLSSLINFESYQTLQEMTITYSSITVFSYYNFPLLQKLNLNNNQLNDFNLNYLPMLKELILCQNDLNNVSDLSLGKLQKLDISAQNNLTEFSNNNLPSLTSFEIQVGNKNINSFKNNSLPLLTSLKLTMSKISSFTNNNLSLVQSLFLGNNRLTHIDNNIIPNVKILYLSGNLFDSSIGQQIKVMNLQKLQQIYLYDNAQITQNDWQKIKTDIHSVAPNATITF